MRPANVEKQYEVAIFDFDGTLLDTEHIYPFIHKEVLRSLGLSEEDIAYMTSDYWHDEVASQGEHIDIPAYLSARHNIDVIPLEFRIIRNEIERQYFVEERQIEGLACPSSYIIRSVIDDLHRLHDEGSRCFIVSHNYGKVIEFVMDSLGLDELFEDYYTQCCWDELRHPIYDRNEPKEKTFAYLSSQASDPSACVVYDDTYEHIRSAIALGMDAVKVDNEHAHPPVRKR